MLMWTGVRAALASLIGSGVALACGSFGTGAAASDPPDAAGTTSGGDASSSSGGGGGVDAAANDGATDAPASGDGATQLGDRFFFTTSLQWTGNLGGLQGADAQCNALALTSQFAPVKAKKFKAWLSTAESSANKRIDRSASRKFIKPDGSLLFAGWAAFATPQQSSTLDFDQSMSAVSGGERVWTGSDAAGNYVDPGGQSTSCAGFTQESFDAIVGDPDDKVNPSRWTNAGGHACTAYAHLYCIEE